eukprot:scaffold1757_cov266-Pinguiococcus_pyrenoidosus.AAC.2
MQPILGAVVLKVVIVWQRILDLVRHASRLKCPTTRDIPKSVASAAEEQHGHIEALHELHALRVSANTKIEAAKAVACADPVSAGGAPRETHGEASLPAYR